MDKYDEQIETLLSAEDFHQEVHKQWLEGKGLFQFATPTGGTMHGKLGPLETRECGCLTMVKTGRFSVIGRDLKIHPTLTAEVQADERMPDDTENIYPEHLPAFAEWQRRLDEEIR